MRYEGERDHFEVDTAALDTAGNVLFEFAYLVRQINVNIQADTVPAAKAFDGWMTGKSLIGLVESWQRELAATAEEMGQLGNKAMEAASNYRAADHTAAATMPPDPTYFHGR